MIHFLTDATYPSVQHIIWKIGYFEDKSKRQEVGVWGSEGGERSLTCENHLSAPWQHPAWWHGQLGQWLLSGLGPRPCWQHWRCLRSARNLQRENPMVTAPPSVWDIVRGRSESLPISAKVRCDAGASNLPGWQLMDRWLISCVSVWVFSQDLWWMRKLNADKSLSCSQINQRIPDDSNAAWHGFSMREAETAEDDRFGPVW